MKAVRRLIMTAITLMILFQTSIFMVVERKLSENKAEQFFNDLKEHILKQLDGEKFEEMEGSTFENVTYKLPERKDAKISLRIDKAEVILDMENKYESYNMTSENMDFEKQQDLIDKKYLKPFLTHLKEIVVDLEHAYAEVKAGLTGVQYKHSDDQVVFETKSVSDLEGEASADTKAFQIEVSGQGMEDGIFGTFVQENDNFKLTMSTKYFQNEFILNVETVNYLKSESKHMLEKVLGHMDKMVRLNESDGDSAEKSLDPAQVQQAIQRSMPKLFSEKFEPKITDKNAIFNSKEDNQTVGQLDFGEVSVGGFNFMNVRCTISRLGGKTFSQNFLQESLYDMGGILDAFLEEMQEYIVHSVNTENPEEFVPAFSPIENERRMRILSSLPKLMIKKRKI